MLCVSLSALESSRHETFGCLNQADVVLEPQSSQGGANVDILKRETQLSNVFPRQHHPAPSSFISLFWLDKFNAASN